MPSPSSSSSRDSSLASGGRRGGEASMSHPSTAAASLPASNTDGSAESSPFSTAEAASLSISLAAATFPPKSRPTTPPAHTAASSTTMLPSLEPQRDGNSADSAGKGDEELALQPGGKRDFGFLPIPKRLRWDPTDPPEFSLLLNAIFGFAATFSVANLYYVQPILISISQEFDVSYDVVVDIPTLLQASYALGLLFICPCGDLVRRRPMLLLLIFVAGILTLVLALVPSIRSFQAISFFLGASSVTPQVLLPLAGDLARPEKRGSALSIVLAGLLLGILLARVLAGVITDAGRVRDVYFMSFGLQVVIFNMLYWTVPDYPAKNKKLSYFQILYTMAKYAVTEPLLIQSYSIALASSAIFAAFWVSSTFLLGDVYGYNTSVIGLFGLVGAVGVCTAPFVGRLVDGLVPWVGVLFGIGVLTTAQVIFTAAGGLSIGAVIVVILLLDIGQQLQQVSNSTRVFSISTEARARLSAVFVFGIFVGQLIGTAAGTRIYLAHGYRASGGFSLALLGFMLVVLFLRGPHLPVKRWIGWEGGWQLRKGVAERPKEGMLEQSEIQKAV